MNPLDHITIGQVLVFVVWAVIRGIKVLFSPMFWVGVAAIAYLLSH